MNILSLFIDMLVLLVVSRTQSITSTNKETWEKKKNDLGFLALLQKKHYIDKSLLIFEFFKNRDDYIIYVTAPSGFGKSVNIQMLKTFLEIKVDDNGKEINNTSASSNYKLFAGLKICRQHPQLSNWTFGLYPVVYIDYEALSDRGSYEGVLTAMRTILWNTFKGYKYLTRVEHFWGTSLDVDTFMKYVDPDKYPSLSEVEIKTGIFYLCKVLFTYFKRKAVVLIDQYDAFVNSVLFGSADGERVYQLFQYINGDLFVGARGYVQRVFCTGRLHVVFGGLAPVDKELQCFPFLHRHAWTAFYGLTGQELKEVSKKWNVALNDSEIKHMKSHYGGYRVMGEKTKIYDISQTIKYLSNKKYGVEEFSKENRNKKIFHPLERLFHCKEVQRYSIKLLQDEYISIPRDLTISEYDILALKQIINSKNNTNTHKFNSIILKYFLQVGVVTYRDLNDKECTLGLPNLKAKLTLSSLLHKVIKNQFNFTTCKEKMFIQNLNKISKKFCKIKDFTEVFNSFNDLITSSSLSFKEDYELQTGLALILLRYKFKNIILDFKTEYYNRSYEFIRVLNKNNVSFIIGCHAFKDIKTFAFSRHFTKNIVQNIKQFDMAQKPTIYKDNVVYIGICLFLNYKNVNTKRKYIDITYVKKLTPKHDINNNKYLLYKS